MTNGKEKKVDVCSRYWFQAGKRRSDEKNSDNNKTKDDSSKPKENEPQF